MDLDLYNPSFDVDVRVDFGGGGNALRVIDWIAYGVDDATVIASGSHDGAQDGPLIHVEGSHAIGRFSLRSTVRTSNWQVGEVIFGSTISNDPVTVSYGATITDSDGDEGDAQMGFHFITSQF